MYHCFGVPVAAAASALPACGSSGSNASAPSELLCIFYKPANPVTEKRVRQGEIQTKKRDRQCHHDRCRNHVRARRPANLAHLHAHIMEKRAQPLPLRSNLAYRLHQRKSADVFVVCLLFLVELRRLRHFSYRLRTSQCFAPPSFNFNLAGEEGFEPPLSVLETDGLPLNLLP